MQRGDIAGAGGKQGLARRACLHAPAAHTDQGVAFEQPRLQTLRFADVEAATPTDQKADDQTKRQRRQPADQQIDQRLAQRLQPGRQGRRRQQRQQPVGGYGAAAAVEQGLRQGLAASHQMKRRLHQGNLTVPRRGRVQWFLGATENGNVQRARGQAVQRFFNRGCIEKQS